MIEIERFEVFAGQGVPVVDFRAATNRFFAREYAEITDAALSFGSLESKGGCSLTSRNSDTKDRAQ